MFQTGWKVFVDKHGDAGSRDHGNEANLIVPTCGKSTFNSCVVGDDVWSRLNLNTETVKTKGAAGRGSKREACSITWRICCVGNEESSRAADGRSAVGEGRRQI